MAIDPILIKKPNSLISDLIFKIAELYDYFFYKTWKAV